MKFYISQATGSVIWYENGQPMFAPIGSNDIVNTDEGGNADLELVGDELVNGQDITISQEYEQVKEKVQN